MVHDPCSMIHQEPMARPPFPRPPRTPRSRPCTHVLSSRLHLQGLPSTTPMAFWLLSHLARNQASLPRCAPCDPFAASFPTPSSYIGGRFLRHSTQITRLLHSRVLFAPLTSSLAHLISPHLVSYPARLPCARGYPSPSPAAPGTICVYCTYLPTCLHTSHCIHHLPHSARCSALFLSHSGLDISSPSSWAHSALPARICPHNYEMGKSHTRPCHGRAMAMAVSPLLPIPTAPRSSHVLEMATLLPCSLKPRVCLGSGPVPVLPAPSLR